MWGYSYHPMRHDPLVYSMVARLRTVLGPFQSWLISDQDGYRLLDGITINWLKPEIEGAPATVASPTLPKDVFKNLNHRQIKILEYIQTHGSIHLQDCLELFEVSKVTASRDLSHLHQQDYVLRLGRGKATKYLLNSESN